MRCEAPTRTRQKIVTDDVTDVTRDNAKDEEIPAEDEIIEEAACVRCLLKEKR